MGGKSPWKYQLLARCWKTGVLIYNKQAWKNGLILQVSMHLAQNSSCIVGVHKNVESNDYAKFMGDYS